MYYIQHQSYAHTLTISFKGQQKIRQQIVLDIKTTYVIFFQISTGALANIEECPFITETFLHKDSK